MLGAHRGNNRCWSFLAVLYRTGPRNAIFVLNIGLSAPAILRALSARPLDPGTGKPKKVALENDPLPHNCRTFLAGR
jgi:hypothetical protein